jgi:hypothetical protein
MRVATGRSFDVLLPEQVIEEVRRNLSPDRLDAFEEFLDGMAYELLRTPTAWADSDVDLVRSLKDLPIAIALLEAGVDIFVTNDRDFTDTGATAARFGERVRVMLPAVFLRDIMGWSPGDLEAIRNRTWDELPESN